jgi:signal transduction histidine kinase/ActR/RegA family two-component response regulator
VNPTSRELKEAYAATLRQALSEAREANLMQAYELGRRALTIGVSVSELGTVHGQALAAALAGAGTSEERDRLNQRAAAFLQEAMAPFEMMLCGYREANTLLQRLNETLEQRVKERTEELHEAARRKDEFLAVLAHELRNPLAPIRNALEVLRLAGRTGLAETEDQALLEMMGRQLGHLARLVDDLLEVSRITRGKIQLRKERVALAVLVETALETSRPLLEAAGHHLTVSLPAQPVMLEADPVRLVQVLANLLNNAGKYTDPGERIALAAERSGDEVVVRVRDSGIGIPEEMLPRVFDMFTQVDRLSGRAQGGLGIGLTVARSLVHLHDGTIEAHSGGPGQGSEFTVRLPVASEPPPKPPGERPPGEDAQSRALSGRRVLIVDDNRDAAESLGLLLSCLGSKVRVVYDGPTALEATSSFRPAVVLLDIGMPGMDGYEVARRVRQQAALKGVTLIALTGWGQEEDRRRCRQAGFDHHLVKPVDVDALQALLESLPALPPGQAGRAERR